MATAKFYVGTLAKYKALEQKDANGLYFIEDAGRIYRGENDMTSDVFYVESVPQDLKENKIAVVKVTANGKTMHDVYVGDANGKPVKAVPGSVDDKAAFDDSATFGAYVPTVSAVKGYVDDTTAAAVSKANKAFVKAEYADGNLKFTPADGSTATDVELTGIAHNIAWDSDAYKLTVHTFGTDDLEINIPKDFFLQSGEYVANHTFNDETTGPAIHLVINIADGGTETKKDIYIPVKELVDVYTGGATDTVKVSVSAGNVVTADVVFQNDGSDGDKILVKSTKGIGYATKTVTDIVSAIETEVQDRKTEDNTITGNLNAEIQNRTQAVSDETKARAEADTQIRTDFAAADTQIKADFAAADDAVRGEFAAADTKLKSDLEKAIEDGLTWNEL